MENIRVMISEEDVNKRIAEMGAQISEDYAGKETKEAGYNLIWKELDKTEMKEETRETLRLKLVEVKDGKRDLYY